jgi:hypothetical protein
MTVTFAKESNLARRSRILLYGESRQGVGRAPSSSDGFELMGLLDGILKARFRPDRLSQDTSAFQFIENASGSGIEIE